MSKYLTIMENHKTGNNMFRNKEELNQARKTGIKKTDWFKSKGYKYVVQVPVTKGQELGKAIQNKLEGICKERIMLQEKFGPTVVNNLRKPNPSPPPRCHRIDCKPCLHGIKDIKCYTNNIGYRIVFNRSPCSDKLRMSQQHLQTDKLRIQLDKLKTDDPKPALYEGETWWSSYSRS